MSYVSVNSEILLSSLNQINYYLNDMKVTRNRLMSSYEKIGPNWNDQKYQRLSEIITTCNRAIKELESNFEVASKSLSTLLKTINLYEEVNLISSSGNPYRSSTSQILGIGNSGPRKFMGVTVYGPIPQGYQELIQSRLKNGWLDGLSLYVQYCNYLNINDTEFTGTNHYTPFNNPNTGESRGVYLNAQNDMTDRRGSGNTYFHELGHMIDHMLGGFYGYFSETSEFHDALIEDGNELLDFYYNRMNENQRSNFNRIIYDDRYSSASDLIDAVTNGQLHGNWGHPRDYWENQGSLEHEAFAHFFEASMGNPARVNVLQNFFPRAYQVFIRQINSLELNI